MIRHSRSAPISTALRISAIRSAVARSFQAPLLVALVVAVVLVVLAVMVVPAAMVVGARLSEADSADRQRRADAQQRSKPRESSGHGYSFRRH